MVRLRICKEDALRSQGKETGAARGTLDSSSCTHIPYLCGLEGDLCAGDHGAVLRVELVHKHLVLPEIAHKVVAVQTRGSDGRYGL